MQIKEKQKNKIKTNNIKFPLPKIKYLNSNSQGMEKLKQINNQPLSNMQNNRNIEQFGLIYPNSYKIKQEKGKEENKLNYNNNIKIKGVYDYKANYKVNNIKNKENKKNIYQNNFKHLLKEFGLSEYTRKLYEFGYDDNNYLKIGALSRKNFNSLLNNIHIFPGHTVKMEKFYEYLRKLNLSSNNNNYNSNSYYNGNNNKKRKLNYNSIYRLNNGNKNQNNNYNHYYNYDNYNINKQSLNLNGNNQKNKKCLSPRMRPKTSHINGFSKPKIRIRNNYSGNRLMKNKIENYGNYYSHFLNNSLEGKNNALIKSYLNDNHKIFLNHKLNINKNMQELHNKYNNDDINNINNNFNIINSKDKHNLLYNSSNNYSQKELEDRINENIEKMLNYYMVQLNDKLDKSFETVEDSSLSYIVTSQNESQNIKNKENKKILPNYKLPSINNNNELINSKKTENNTNNKPMKSKLIENNKNTKKGIEKIVDKRKEEKINSEIKNKEKEKEKKK
jgi:hypothetical protein